MINKTPENRSFLYIPEYEKEPHVAATNEKEVNSITRHHAYVSKEVIHLYMSS